MEEKQKFLMGKTKEYLQILLDSIDEYSIYPDAGAMSNYTDYLSQLVIEFPNQETLSLGIELMHLLYEAKEKAPWVDMIERHTIMSLSF